MSTTFCTLAALLASEVRQGPAMCVNGSPAHRQFGCLKRMAESSANGMKHLNRLSRHLRTDSISGKYGNSH